MMRCPIGFCTALVLAALASGAVGQYYTGYGTGPLPLSPVAIRRLSAEQLEDLRPAVSAARLADLIYGQQRRRDDQTPVQVVEPIYKYRRPNFPTRFHGDRVIALFRRR